MRENFYKKSFAVAMLATFILMLLPMSFSLWSTSLPRQSIALKNSFIQVPQKLNIAIHFTPKLALADATQTTGTGTAANVGGNPYACGLTTLQTCIPFFVFWIIDTLGGLLISFCAAMVSWLLVFNQQVFASLMVQTGFSVCLAIANLGFILGIIVIAIATILRSQTYGAKQLLWKLVVMAILVNFGLVITRPIVGISDSFSNYFLNSISGTTNGSPTTGADGLSVALIGLMSPQTFLGTASATAASKSSPIAKSVGDQFVADLMTMFFAAIIVGIMILALLALAVLLFVRYVYLAILLILLPFAWLMWVFPTFRHQFSEWWSNFIKWTFFPPVALFFIYLVILTLTKNAQQLPTVSSTSPSSGGTGFTGALSQASNVNSQSGAQNILQQGLDDLALAALMIGGLFAAQKMTGEMGSKTISVAKGASGWVAGKAGGIAARQGKKAARLGYQKVGGEKINKALQGGLGMGRIPILGRGVSALGRGLGNISSNEKLVDEAKKNVPKNPDEIRNRLAGAMSKQDQFAHISRLIEMGELRGDEKVNGKSVTQFMDENPDAAKRFGQGKLIGDVDKAAGGDKAVREAAAHGTPAQLSAAMDAFVRKLDKSKDPGKMNVNAIFDPEKGSPLIARALLTSVAQNAPQLFPGMLARANGETLGVLGGRDNADGTQTKGMYEEYVKPIMDKREASQMADRIAEDRDNIKREQTSVVDKYTGQKTTEKAKSDAEETERAQKLTQSNATIQQEIEALRKKHSDIISGIVVGSKEDLDKISQQEEAYEKQKQAAEAEGAKQKEERAKLLSDKMTALDKKAADESLAVEKTHVENIQTQVRKRLGSDIFEKNLAGNTLFSSNEPAATTPTPTPTPQPTPKI